jgi:hypothetical protein
MSLFFKIFGGNVPAEENPVVSLCVAVGLCAVVVRLGFVVGRLLVLVIGERYRSGGTLRRTIR